MKGEETSILAGWLIDGSGGPVQEKMVVKIVDGRFAEVTPYTAEGQAATGQILDYSHCTLLPSFVDSHVHLFMSGSIDSRIRERQLIAGYDELRPVIGHHLHHLFSHGIVAVRDGGDRGGFAQRYLSEPEMHRGVIVKVAGRGWHRKNRYGGLIGRAVHSGEELVSLYEGEKDEIDHVKLVNSGLNSLKTFAKETEAQFTSTEIAGLVRIAQMQGRKVMVHANGREPVREAVEGGCHSIEHGYFMGRDNLQRLADRGVVWVPTIFTMKAYGANCDHIAKGGDPQVIEQTIAHQLEQLSLARDLGVKVALGTDAGSLGVLHGESLVEEMKLFRQAGYSLSETIRCATATGAELLGLKDLGLVRQGARASFVIARGGPSQLPRKLTYLEGIYVDGKPSEYYRKNPLKHVS